MINEVVLEGIVVRTWKFADDLLIRLACYRDPDLPQKSRSDRMPEHRLLYERETVFYNKITHLCSMMRQKTRLSFCINFYRVIYNYSAKSGERAAS